MRHDPYFKFLAATLIAAVLLAFLTPTSAKVSPKPANTVAASTVTRVSVKG